LEQPHFVSELDKHLYAIYADDCARKGNPQEGIHTLQELVKSSPDYVAGWLQLAALLVETGQLHKALATMHEFTIRHPQYHKGHRAFKQLLHKCSHPAFFSAPSLSTGNQVYQLISSRGIPTFTDK
jgi:predicted Zn-dependent protease